MLTYNVALMEQHLSQGHKQLPMIINLCLYAGIRSPYPYPTDIYDCFEDANLAREEMFKPFNLIDLTVLSEQELLQDGQADLLEILLKQGIKREFLSWITKNKELIAKLFDRVYTESGIIYILDTDEKNDPQELIDAIITVVPDKKEIIMTAAQQLRQQGIQEGIHTKAIDIAKNMLKKGFDISFIQEMTGLTQETIENIKLD
jgi:predicted transposase/invertase (TIGR01784 family)